MNISFSRLLKIITILSVYSVAQSASTSDNHSYFSPATPISIDNIHNPAAQKRLEALTSQSREHAIDWLNTFSFSAMDLKYIHFDQHGSVFYKDEAFPQGAIRETNEPDDEPHYAALESVFTLHSKPGASKVFVLDFTGHLLTDTAWNNNEPSYSAFPYDLDGDAESFSDTERASIHEIWHRIAEDYAPFDIDITTEEPATYTPTTGHLLITRSTSGDDKPMPHMEGAGGVAYVNVWGRPDYNYYSPALVYYDHLASGTSYIAEAASHEAGHNLGLSHDGHLGSSYYLGHGSGANAWAPIMGAGYYKNVTQWSQGEYDGATQDQDDLAILASQLDYRSDDHGDSRSKASELVINAQGDILVSNPETDPQNSIPGNKGIIETRDDRDFFSFSTSASTTVDLEVIPAWDAFYRNTLRGANLDVSLTLLNETAVIGSSDPSPDTHARIVETLPAGRYYLVVSGAGNDASPYSDYGSIGQYFISGSIPPANDGDTTAPSPDPMGWAVEPYAIDKSSIAMTALTASDESSGVEYRFTCTASDCPSSHWQAESHYVATELNPGTLYSFQVQARDTYNNSGAVSTTVEVATAANQLPIAKADSGTGDEDTSISIAVLNNDSDPDGDTLSLLQVEAPANGMTSYNAGTIIYTPNADFNGSDSFRYHVGDGFGGRASAQVDISVEPINDAPVARDDKASLGTNKTIIVKVLKNDSDADGDTLSIVSVSPATQGSVSIIDDTIAYTSGSSKGSETLTYTISDGTLSSSASLTLTTGGFFSRWLQKLKQWLQ